jgi:hypothetical protein
MAMTKGATASKPKVVFDVKMPKYEYRQGDGQSLSVDRKRTGGDKPPVDCLANIGA